MKTISYMDIDNTDFNYNLEAKNYLGDNSKPFLTEKNPKIIGNSKTSRLKRLDDLELLELVKKLLIVKDYNKNYKNLAENIIKNNVHVLSRKRRGALETFCTGAVNLDKYLL